MAHLAKRLRPIPVVGITTNRTSLEVLGLPMPFTQTPVLEPSDFLRESARRGVRLDPSLLEDLHRHGILVPFYLVRQGTGRRSDIVDVSKSRIADVKHSGIAPRLIGPASRGEVADPGHSRFRLWARKNNLQVQPNTDPGIYYSRHQLLLLPYIQSFVDQHHTYFVGRSAATARSYQRLDPANMPDARFEIACAEWRSLAVILSSLDTIILPELYRKVSWPDQWNEVRDDFDANAALAWLGLSPADARTLAGHLLWSAHNLDEAGDLYDVIRRAAPDAWEALSGRSLMAHDLRVAAEILIRVVEMADGIENYDDNERDPIGAQRLSTRGRDLDEVLTTKGLSPHPSLVVIVEGETEMLLFPRVMATLGAPLKADRIRVENRGGLDDPVALLARYAARPILGDTTDQWAFLARPLTRVLVLADPEKDYATEERREKQRDHIARSIVSEMPKDLHDDLLAAGSELVTVHAWGDGPFEFSHFSDEELADGLLAMALANYPSGRDELIKRIGVERAKPHAAKKRKGPDVETIWDEWIPDYGFSKKKFADQMWPTLEAKIRMSMSGAFTNPSIMDAALAAQRLSHLPRRRVVLERSSADPPTPVEVVK